MDALRVFPSLVGVATPWEVSDVILNPLSLKGAWNADFSSPG